MSNNFAERIESEFGTTYRLLHQLVDNQSGQLHRVEVASTGQVRLLRILDVEIEEPQGIGSPLETFLVTFDSVKHPKIHSILKTGFTSSKRPFSVSTDADGEPLETVLNSNEILPCQTAVEIALGIASSLRFAHDLNIYHANLCPANVFVRKYKKRWQLTCLVGFEINPIVSSLPEGDRSKYFDVQYLAPEQLNGEAGDQRSDIYSIGCLLYKMCTGRTPPTVLSREIVPIRADRNTALTLDLIEKSDTAVQFPVGLKEIIHRCLEPSRDERYRNVSELEKDLLAVRAAVKVFPVWMTQHRIGAGMTALIIAAVTLSSMTLLADQVLGRIESSFLIPQVGLKKAVYRSRSARTMQDAVAEAVSNNVSLERANLYGANLSGMNLRGAKLQNAYISGLLIDTDLSGADLRGATLEHCKGLYSKLEGANLEGATIKNCDFAFSDFTDVNVKGASFITTNLYHAKTSGTTFDAKQVPGIYFDGARRVRYKDR